MKSPASRCYGWHGMPGAAPNNPNLWMDVTTPHGSRYSVVESVRSSCHRANHPVAFRGAVLRKGKTFVSDLRMPLEPASRGAPFPGTYPHTEPASTSGSVIFTVVIDRHGDEIYRYACQLTGNATDADDLYQETLLKAFRAFDRLPSDANHRAWLYRICSNTFISDRRKHGRVAPMNDVLAETLTASHIDHASALDARELLKDVERFVDALPPKQRVALVLRKHHEYGYAEIASILNSSEAAARANVHEALTKLRGAFADRMEV